jgi:hypothetical protein
VRHDQSPTVSGQEIAAGDQPKDSGGAGFFDERY